MSTDVGIWVGALMTIAVFSYLFSENEFYKAVEHIYVGAAAGYSIVLGFSNVVTKGWQPLVEGRQFQVLIPVAMGLMLFAPYAGTQYNWMRRIPISFIVGIGAGITIRSVVIEQFVKQLSATILPFNSVNNVIIVLGTLAVLSYFFFTFKPSRALKTSAEVGKWIIMITFGASFGNAVMGRISLLIGRIDFMFREWIHLIKL
ncbi:MAG TPA: hypothetical protein GX529_03385 [Firmicutes bacterium]|nr:hypothetical protein [Candidatus Fermentithermobacillaceae bacterium]